MTQYLRKISLSSLLLLAITFLPSAAISAELPNFVDLAEKAGQAVVNIDTERNVQGGFRGMLPEEMFRGLPPEFNWFLDKFDQFNRGGEEAPSRLQRSMGTGFIISKDGYIVTNNHVIDGVDKVTVSLAPTSNTKDNSQKFEATIVGTDPETDIALLKVESKEDLPFLSFGNSDAMKVGEWLLAIGNPFGLGHTVTSGILSAKGRDIQAGPFDNFLQTDASINPGNSGGPLLNMQGEVIGINTAIVASGQGIGFAIPSTMANDIIEQLKTGKKVRRGWIGVSIQELDENTAKALGLKNAEGALIGSVMEGEPAAKAGMEAGDVVVQLNGKTIDSASALLHAIAAESPGTKVRLTVMRAGKPKTLTVTLAERNPTEDGAEDDKKATPDALGLSVRALKQDELHSLQIEGGVLITRVTNGTAAQEQGLQKGDIILSANLKKVQTPKNLAQVIQQDAKKKGAVMLQIMRRDQTFFVTLPLNEEKK